MKRIQFKMGLLMGMYFSVHSSSDSCVWGAFLVAQLPCKQVAKPRGKILPATFLMTFECRPLLSPWLEPFDYPVTKGCVIRN